jgi:hypothetical protein
MDNSRNNNNDNDNENPNGMPTSIMLPGMSLDDRPVRHVLTIKPAHNGYAVFLEEDVKVKKTISKTEISNSIHGIMSDIQKAATGDEIYKIIRENDMKPDPNDLPEIEVGMYVFKTLEEMQGFQKMVYDRDEQQLQKYLNKRNQEPVKQKYNSQMPGK